MSAASPAAAVDGEAEGPPAGALPEEEDEEDSTLGVFEHQDNIYSFMILYPELARLKHGHYWNTRVWLAFALFSLILILQMSLTHIAGYSILEETTSYRLSLLDGLSINLEDVRDKVDAIAGGVAGDGPEATCCRGPACHHLACCPPKGQTAEGGARDSTGWFGNAASLAQVHKSRSKGRPPSSGGALTPSAPRASPMARALSFLERPEREKAWKEKKEGEDKSKVGGEDEGGTICRSTAQHLDCTQPSFAFIDHWSELDVNGDGVWTFEEAVADDANLACQLKWTTLSTEDVFRGACRSVQRHFEDLAAQRIVPVVPVPQGILLRKNITANFFHFFRSTLVLCSAVDTASCGRLIRQGIFDGALPQGGHNAFGSIKGLDQALDYCQRMLVPGGICDRSLPVTWIQYRQRVTEKCGARVFSVGDRYTNPFDRHDEARLADVNFGKIAEYETAGSLKFRFFLALILFIWFSNALRELQSIILLMDLVVNYPVEEVDPFRTSQVLHGLHRRGREAVDVAFRGIATTPSTRSTAWHARLLRHISLGASPEHPHGMVQIKALSRLHRGTCWLIVIVRLVVLCYMMAAGTIFLVTTDSYPELLMNAVALAFVFELPELFYCWLVSKREKEALESVEPLTYTTSLPKHGALSWVLSVYVWGLLIFPFLSVALVHWNYVYNTNPVYEALQCACYQDGPRCLAKEYLSKTWWDKQWREVAWLTS